MEKPITVVELVARATEGEAKSLVRLPEVASRTRGLVTVERAGIDASAVPEPTYVSVGSYWNFIPGTRRVDAFTDPLEPP